MIRDELRWDELRQDEKYKIVSFRLIMAFMAEEIITRAGENGK